MGRGKRKVSNVGSAVARSTLVEEPPGRTLRELPLEVRLTILDVLRQLAVDARRDAKRAAKRAAVRKDELDTDKALSGTVLEALHLRRTGRLHLRRAGAHSTLCGKRVPPRLWRDLQEQAEGTTRVPIDGSECRACLGSARSLASRAGEGPLGCD
jgi:hypothetical protein